MIIEDRTEVSGTHIFCDQIWLMQGMMKADHRLFKAHGQYDFPQKQWKGMLAMHLVGWMMGNEKLMKKAGGKMTDGMLMSCIKVLEQTHKEMNRQP